MQKTLTYPIGIFALAVVSTSGVAADAATCDTLLTSAFIESAPRDSFTFTNSSKDNWMINSISVDLEGSAGKLIFDTEDGGTGVEVFQTYRTESSEAELDTVIEPEDGGKTMQLNFSSFSTGQSFRFSVDVDDTLERSDLRQIRVTGGELNGATLEVTFTHSGVADMEPIVLTGSYNEANKAEIKPKDC